MLVMYIHYLSSLKTKLDALIPVYQKKPHNDCEVYPSVSLSSLGRIRFEKVLSRLSIHTRRLNGEGGPFDETTKDERPYATTGVTR